tara:strand:- start:56 stop:349 length:294 start_codon:yes stop_codon:yes gene_type:complete
MVFNKGEVTMSWKDIVKGVEEYSFYFGQIEKVENLLEKLYEHIENSAIKMNKETGLAMERSRSIITSMQKPTILEIEKTIEELKEKLKTTYNWKKRN